MDQRPSCLAKLLAKADALGRNQLEEQPALHQTRNSALANGDRRNQQAGSLLFETFISATKLLLDGTPPPVDMIQDTVVDQKLLNVSTKVDGNCFGSEYALPSPEVQLKEVSSLTLVWRYTFLCVVLTLFAAF